MVYREAAATRTVALNLGFRGSTLSFLACSRQRSLPYSTRGQLWEREQGSEEQSMKIWGNKKSNPQIIFPDFL